MDDIRTHTHTNLVVDVLNNWTSKLKSERNPIIASRENNQHVEVHQVSLQTYRQVACVKSASDSMRGSTVRVDVLSLLTA